jgi:hypothetical protein
MMYAQINSDGATSFFRCIMCCVESVFKVGANREKMNSEAV